MDKIVEKSDALIFGREEEMRLKKIRTNVQAIMAENPFYR